MHKRLKISHHSHTWRLRPHEHTSYLPLFFLLLVVGFVLTFATANAADPWTRPGPQAGSIGLSGTMPAKPPSEGATINQPGNGQRFNESPITISGKCPPGTLVEIFKNDIFAGSVPCTAEGTFTILVDLLIGQNTIIARVYDDLNQPGPDSNAITIFYDALPFQASPISSLNFGAMPLLLNTDAVFRGIFPSQEMNIPITVIGGTPPYAVNIQWGDSTNKVVPRNDNLTFKVGHTYNKPGVFQITLQATDSQGRVAFLTVAAIVNGQPPTASAETASTPKKNWLLALWPLYTSAVAIAISFYLGERREKHILMNRGAVYHT